MGIMKLALFFCAVAAFGIRCAHSSCNPGEESVGGAASKIKLVCQADGETMLQVACLPNGKLNDSELNPGEEYETAAYVYNCTQVDATTLSFDAVECVSNGTRFGVGQEVGIVPKGSYECVRISDGNISRKLKQGCYFNDTLFVAGQTWTYQGADLVCKKSTTVSEYYVFLNARAVLLNPPNDAQFPLGDPIKLRWTKVPGAIEYIVVIGNQTVNVTQSRCPTRSYVFTPTTLGNITWTVEALTDFGASSGPTDPFAFVVV